MRTDKVAISERLASAFLGLLAGGVTGSIVWVLFAMWLGQYILTPENLYYLDTVVGFSIVPAIIGFIAPNRMIALFATIWGWMWKIASNG